MPRLKNEFNKVLISNGFKRLNIPELDNQGVIAYQHDMRGWYAEALDRGRYYDLWLVGHGLKQSSTYPGGWIYSEPKELADELKRVTINKQ
jgi:hypothetical protein